MMAPSSRIVVTALLVATPALAPGQRPAGTARPTAEWIAARVDSIVNLGVLGQGMPSVSIVVTRGNETLVERAWGFADVAAGRKAEPSTVYQIGSLRYDTGTEHSILARS